jgi:hypothetical protein
LADWVWLEVYNLSLSWKARKIRALVAPSLCTPLILGLPFLAANHIVIDHEARTVIDKRTKFNLLNPKHKKSPERRETKKRSLKKDLIETQKKREKVMTEIRDRVPKLEPSGNGTKLRNYILAIVRQRVETLAAQQELINLGADIMQEFDDVFQRKVPQLERLRMTLSAI